MQHLRLAQTLIHYTRARAREARASGRNQVGASAIEWAIISAVVVVLAGIVFAAIRNVVDTQSSNIEEGSNLDGQ